MAVVRSALSSVTHFAPTRRLAVLVALCAPVWLISTTPPGRAIAAAAAALLVLAMLIDMLRTPGARDVEVRRLLRSTVGLGDRAEGTYEIESHWPATLHATLHQALPAAVEGSLPSSSVLLRPGQPPDIPFSVLGRVRGVHALGPIALEVRGPLELVRHTLIYTQNDTITVIPSVAGARGYRLLALQQRVRAAGNRILRRRGTGAAFANLRDYAVGDDPRHIDWKASARRERLISREYNVEQGQTVMIAVDTGRMMTQLAGDRPRFEYALASALTLADVALATGDRVGLLLFDDEVRSFLPPVRAAGTLANIRDALVAAQTTMTEPDYAAAFRTLATRHRRRSLIVLFTDVIDPRASRALVAHTVQSATRHLPLVVALQNEQLVQAAIPQAGATAAELYQSVAAEELISARSEALLAMRQAGVAVLDTPPRAMTAALVNRYIEIKDRSLL